MGHDVIIVGGSYAGMAAALQIVRARRSVLLVDAGERRNRFAAASHGFLGRDGADPAAIVREARAELARYPTLTVREGLAEAAEGERDAFRVRLDDGSVHAGRRLLFATGVRDILPAVEGLAERWGRSVFHCPYCHGYELGRGRIGVIAAGPMSTLQATMVAEWGATTLFTNGALALDDAARRDLAARGIALEETAVARIEGEADVRLADGRLLEFAGLFTHGRNEPATSVAERLGCALEETPFGVQLRTDARKETSVAGAFACGDVAKVPHSVSLAVGDGAFAGAQVHHSLVF